jgi:RNA polymerase sigma-70 factor, ECF subfamily
VVSVNGQSGIINIVDEHTHSIFSFEWAGNQICSIFAAIDPAKLGAVKIKLLRSIAG